MQSSIWWKVVWRGWPLLHWFQPESEAGWRKNLGRWRRSRSRSSCKTKAKDNENWGEWDGLQVGNGVGSSLEVNAKGQANVTKEQPGKWLEAPHSSKSPGEEGQNDA